MHLLRKHTARLRPVHLFMWDERNGFDMTILVIDGQGGKLGKRLVESIKKSFPQVEVMAVGTNSAASESTDCIHYISVMLLGCYQRKHGIVRKI